jgi:hypothetical protein
MSVNRYLTAARHVAQVIPGILAQRGLKPFISRFVLTETEQGNAWLFVVLEVNPLHLLEDYAASDVLEDLSMALHGLPVVICGSYGLRYAVLLGSPNSFKSPDRFDHYLPQPGDLNIPLPADANKDGSTYY